MSNSAKVIVNCKNCGDPFTARVADRKRGWARFCSKSCKAVKQEKRTGQYAMHRSREVSGTPFSEADFDDDKRGIRAASKTGAE